MLDKDYSTNNKRVVLLLLSFVLLVSCCVFGVVGVKSVSADEVDSVVVVDDGYGLSYFRDELGSSCRAGTASYVRENSLYICWGGGLFVGSVASPFDDYTDNLTLTSVSFACKDGVSDLFVGEDFSFSLVFDSPLVFSYSTSNSSGGSTPVGSYVKVSDYGSNNLCLCFPSSFSAIVDTTVAFTYLGDLSSFFSYFYVRGFCINGINYIDDDFEATRSLFETRYCYLSLEDYSKTSVIIKGVYNVSFLDKDLSLLSSDKYFYGEYATIPTAPNYEGYDFIGWLPNVSGVSVSDPITCDVTFTATYSIKQYSVVLKDYDGIIISSSMVDYGNSFNTDYVPTRVGYTFVGYTSSSGYSFGSPVYEDIVLIANYEINRYSVLFKDYDGSIISSLVVDYGSKVIAPNSPTLVGHTFEGWSCSNGSYGIGSVVDCDLLFVANYSLNTYLISFYDYDNSPLGSVVVSFGYRISSSDIPNVSRVGYMFNGWDSSIDGFNVTDIVYCNVDFTANYSIITEFWNGYEYAKDENYNNGYDEGYLSGKDDFYSSGYDDGYSSGYGVGFSEGENSALSSKDTFKSFMYSIIDAPFNVLSNAFSFEIFGINLSYFLISIVSLLLVAVVIRKLI